MTLSRKLIALAVSGAGLLALANSAVADDPAGTVPKLYHWVGADGKDHYSDSIPPEALNQAREELSKSGLTIKAVGRAQTTEEKAAALAKAAADASAAATVDKAKQADQVLLSSYPNEAELKRAFQDRLEQQSESLKTIRIELESQQQSLNSLLVAASNLELSDKPIDADLAKKIQTQHAQVLEDQKGQVQQLAQGEKLREESAAQLARYRGLRADADAKHEGDEAPANGSPPKG